ncbi:MAG: nucleotidyltransferase substrate binding protein [Verrucomicrobia bacterium]|nr:nucleotidyltransferase substrate binding protein [Deltaproteobacteria bacterium]
MSEDIRWKQHFNNLQLAYARLRQAVSANADRPDDNLIQLALIKAFEMTFVLAWKTMKDYIKFNGIDVKLPREIIKQAYANDIIIDGQMWIDMLENCNVMAHVYDEARARETVCRICQSYMSALEQLHDFLMEKAS